MGAYLNNMVGFWKNGKIPYEIVEDGLSSEDIADIKATLESWQEQTVLEFTERTNEKPYLKIKLKTDLDISNDTYFLGKVVHIPIGYGGALNNFGHEIGHAIGLIHEHQRPDRDRHVRIVTENIEYNKSDFRRKSSNHVTMVTGYDYQSIMHYRSNAYGKELELDWSSGWTDAVFIYDAPLSSKMVLAKKSTGNVHIHRMKATGEVGKRLSTLNIGAGWENLWSWNQGESKGRLSNRVSAWKPDSSQLAIWELDEDNQLDRVAFLSIDPEWTHLDWACIADPATGDQSRYVCLYNTGTGDATLRKLQPTGTLEPSAHRRDVGTGWDWIKVLNLYANHEMLLLLYRSDGRVELRSLTDQVGDVIATDNWGGGWTQAKWIHLWRGSRDADGLMRINEATGAIEIYEVDTSGKVSPIDKVNWPSGWTTVERFRVKLYDYGFLFLLKKSSGEVQINNLDADGTIGDRVRVTTIEAVDPSHQDELGGFGGTPTASDLAAVNALYPGDMHIHLMLPEGSTQGMVGAMSAREDWSEGWTIAEPFTSGGNHYLFLLKTASGLMRVHKLNINGSVGELVDERHWSPGWKNAQFFNADGRTAVILLKESDGTMHSHFVGTDGVIGEKIDDENWAAGWTHASTYEIDGAPYLLIYRWKTGAARLYQIAPTGGVADYKETDIGKYWSSVRTYTDDSGTYLVLLSVSEGRVQIRRINEDRTVSNATDHDVWSDGWTQAVPFSVDNKHYLFLLKVLNGVAHINRLDSNGKLGARVYENEGSWSRGWSIARFFSFGIATFLFLLKTAGE